MNNPESFKWRHFHDEVRGYLGFFSPKGLKKVNASVDEGKKQIYQQLINI